MRIVAFMKVTFCIYFAVRVAKMYRIRNLCKIAQVLYFVRGCPYFLIAVCGVISTSILFINGSECHTCISITSWEVTLKST